MRDSIEAEPPDPTARKHLQAGRSAGSLVTTGRIDRSVVRLAEAFRHRGKQLTGEAGDLIDDATKLALTEHHKFHIGLRHHRRVARRTFEEGEFAERVAGTDGCDLSTMSEHTRGAAHDHEELVASLPLGHQRLAGRDTDVLRMSSETLEILTGTRRKQRDLLEMIDQDITATHNPKSNDQTRRVHLDQAVRSAFRSRSDSARPKREDRRQPPTRSPPSQRRSPTGCRVRDRCDGTRRHPETMDRLFAGFRVAVTANPAPIP